MVEVEAKKVVLKNLAGEYLVPVTEPYIAGEGIKIENNIISANIDEIGGTVSDTQLQNKANIDANNFSDVGKNYISSLSMPSNRYIDLALGISETTYTAPANGWIYVNAIATTDNASWACIDAGYNFVSGIDFSRKDANSQLSLPVRKNQRFVVRYGSCVLKLVRFFYAEGAQ